MLFVERIERAELWNDCVDYVEGYENAAPAANETKRAANAMVHLCQGLISIADERDRMTKGRHFRLPSVTTIFEFRDITSGVVD